MKWLQNGNLAKLVAFFVIAVVITCTVSFAANGWQSFIEDPDSDKIVDNTNSDKVDENTGDDSNNEDNDVPVIAPEPKYYHYITGLETTLEASIKKPLCVVFSSRDPLYGISSSFMTVEFPIEYGETRLLCFTDSAQSLGKLGSIAPSRGYISNFATYFGGVLLSYGYDDSFDYDYYQPNNHLDFANTPGYCYTEYNTMVYTNGDLVNAFINNSKINTVTNDTAKLPYEFTEVDANPVSGAQSAKSVIIKYSDSNSTELIYSAAEGKYFFSKNSGIKNDLLNDKSLSYENVFILYADSTTYETSDSTQIVLNTATGGKGKYISGGSATEITWTKDVSGNLTFFDSEGQKLIINRGASYIAVVKSSNEASVKIS